MKALFFILVSALFLKAASVSEIYSLAAPACDIYDLNFKKCSSGDGEACYLAALILNNRSCTRKNDDLALEFFEKSCSLGYAKGCIFMGQAYSLTSLDEKHAKIKTYYERACELDAKFCDDYGLLYFYGEGVKKDELAAKEYFKKSCDAGNPAGCGHFATSLNREDKDINEITKFYEIGCNGEHYPSCYAYGLLLWAKVDKNEGKNFCKKACDRGNIKEACKWVLDMSEEEKEQILYLRRYLKLGCEDGDAQMCKDLGKIGN